MKDLWDDIRKYATIHAEPCPELDSGSISASKASFQSKASARSQLQTLKRVQGDTSFFVRITSENGLTYKTIFMAYHSLTGKIGYVYILANYSRNVLYVGVTSDLVYRVGKHKIGKGAKFTAKYNVKYLMHIEEYPNIDRAIQREKQLKNWHHQWKINLIKQSNPSMKDLWDDIQR